MLDVCASTRATIVVGCELEDSELLARWDVRRHSAGIRELLLCFVIGAHFLEYIHALRRRGDYLRTLHIESRNEGVSRVRIHIAYVLNVGSLGKVKALAWLQVRTASLYHGDIK